jgi:hypothetical protein
MNNPIAIHEDKNSEKVIKFIELEHFTQMFQDMYNNNLIHGCYYKDGSIIAQDTDGDEVTDII